jgi:hypothetical protein
MGMKRKTTTENTEINGAAKHRNIERLRKIKEM